MFCKQPPRMARYAAVVAAIIMAMLPSQALVCRHCLLHNIVELANEHTSDEHPHVHDSLNAECTDCCGKSHSGEDEGSHRDCPNCVGSIDDGILLLADAAQRQLALDCFDAFEQSRELAQEFRDGRVEILVALWTEQLTAVLFPANGTRSARIWR